MTSRPSVSTVCTNYQIVGLDLFVVDLGLFHEFCMLYIEVFAI